MLEYRVSPAVFLGAFIANLTTAGSIGTSFAIATGNVLESLVGAYLINRWSDGRSTFDTPAGVARFALICLLSTVISPTFGVGSLSLAGYADWSEFPSIWTTWWMGDLSGALVITPAIVLWGTRSSGQIERRELLQSCAVYTATIVVGLLAFSPLLEQSPTQSPLAFLTILPLMWAALRRNQRDTAVKYGALSVPTGMVKIRWGLETDETHNSLLRIIWKEVGGPPVEEPQRQGFGDIVLTKVVPVSLRGTASLEFEPEGIKWVLLAPSIGVLA
jgi:integral membrane sensor domain MASE1